MGAASPYRSTKSRGSNVPKNYSKCLAQINPKGCVMLLQVTKRGSIFTASQISGRIRCGWVPETRDLLFFVQVSKVVSGFSPYSSIPMDRLWSTFSLRKQYSMPHTMWKAAFTNLLILFRSSARLKDYGNHFYSMTMQAPTRPRSL